MIAQIYGQQKIYGKIIDDHKANLSAVLVLNVTKNIRTTSDASGNFVIEADENDEVRFLKETYYRADKIIKKENFNNEINVALQKVEILIPEVKLEYKPTGDLKKDSKHLEDSKKVAALKSSMEAYMKSPLIDPLPKNEIQKTFKGHDFQAGHASLDIFETIAIMTGLVKKMKSPKITAPTYGETQDFLKRVKSEVDLIFLKKYDMNEEGIDHFLYYAEQVHHLSKRFRKDFKPLEVEYSLRAAFVEYSKLNKLSSQ